ncbi:MULTISPECIES: glutamate ABC transporter substrate-binding protein [unclassified Streptomyces]|uniref:glutamate ABC transporter substrate-binding protein n=1 Tax=unclassified Streptomyces TaxID=2593676 RepID=UPI0006B04788|nr:MULTISPECIES: glutamate ABC transporter substrate-binding protein [unclassified Streptomyces]KOX16398.1 glutamate-binding protein [Streptomyces sp. NRRL F-6491]KOX39233.1 glutamate-binding protein [Streptomyces sp. NRRL F-6492]
MKLRNTSAAAAAVALLALTATACGGGSDSGSNGDKITVGIKFDQPGLGLKTPDGTYAGFDVDVARYVAKELGYAEDKINFKQAPSAERENLIKNGDVKFIVASYSINDKRKKEVDFAGPYFLAHQDLLVRSDDSSITKVEDLNAKKLCSVTGSTSAQNVRDKLAPKADLRQLGGYSECLTGLENKRVDALTTDDSILAGYASQKENQGKFKLVGLRMSDEKYGIGVKKGDDELRGKINKALEKMVSDGTWKKLVETHFGPSGYKYEPAPKVEG